MTRPLLLLSLVLAAAAAVILPGVLVDEGAEGVPVEPPSSEGPSEPVLVGPPDAVAVEPEVDPFADETDVKTLLQRSGVGNGAQARLLELARTRAGLVAELVDWLRPDHDGERAPPRPAGQQYSGPAMPGLYVLGDTLIKLAPDSVALLAAVLDDEDPVFRERVAAVLGRMGATAAAAAPALVARLEPDREDVGGQCAMLRALGAMGGAAEAAVPVFLEHLRDSERLDDARAAVAESFFEVVGRTPEAFEAARLALRDQSYEVCTRLIPILGAMGAQARVVVPELLDIVLDPMADHGVEMLAVEALGRVADAGPKVRSILLDVALDDTREGWRRGTAMSALARLGDEALEPLFGRLAGADTDQHLLAFTYLRDIDTVPAGPLLALLDPVRRDEDPRVRGLALESVARVPGRSAAVLDWLEAWPAGEFGALRARVLGVAASREDDTGRVIDLLVSALDDEDPQVRDDALRGLERRSYGTFGDGVLLRRASVVDAVRARLRDELPMIRARASWWIAKVAPTYDLEALPVWLEQLEGDWGHVDMLPVLRRLGPKAEAALPALEAQLASATTPVGRADLQATIDAIRGKR